VISISKPIAWVSGGLFAVSGLIGAAPLILGILLGLGIVLLSTQLKRRLWSVALLVAGLAIYATLGGATDKWGAILMVVASGLGLASTFI
jgi:hypothetical protein